MRSMFNTDIKNNDIRIGHIEIKLTENKKWLSVDSACGCLGGVSLPKEYLKMLIESLQYIYKEMGDL